MTSINLTDSETPKIQGGRSRSAKPLKTACELGDINVEQAILRYGPWPVGMTLFIFDDACGWTASISRPRSQADNFYRTCTLDLIAGLATKYDLDVPRLSNDRVFQSHILFAWSSNLREIDMPKGQQRGNREAKKPKKEKIKMAAAAPSRKVTTRLPIIGKKR
jgi:hypothetical protein